MPDLPRYQGDDREPTPTRRSAPDRGRRSRTLGVALALALVLLLVVLHLTGVVGPGAH